MDLKLQDKVVLVTGGSKGIGAGIVRSFLAEGARVANVNRSTTEGIALEAEYAAQSKDCFFIQGDLSEVDACRNAIEATIQKFGRIDILVNNAGVNDSVGLDQGPDAFVESLKKNLIHCYSLVHYALDELKKSQGVIINISSKVAVTGQGGTSGYAAAKGGYRRFNSRMGGRSGGGRNSRQHRRSGRNMDTALRKVVEYDAGSGRQPSSHRTHDSAWSTIHYGRRNG